MTHSTIGVEIAGWDKCMRNIILETLRLLIYLIF